jgi:hypothetical protein
MDSKLEWYGYLHVNGTYLLKRYWGDPGDIFEMKESDFVLCSTGPFEAVNREDALEKLKELLQ